MPLTFPSLLSHAERVLEARRRYFEEGVLPTGVVSDVVFQSWNRCHRAHHEPQRSIEFQPVSVSRSQLALQKNRALHEAWLEELPGIGSALGSTKCSAILTDASGVLIGVTPKIWPHLDVIPVAHRLGVNLSEEMVGTTAPGLVVRTGKAASVYGAEHFYDSVSAMYCTAAPIHNPQGQLAGILDISCEGHRFHFDPVTVVGLYAALIENRLLVAQAKEQFIVRFQFVASMVDTPMAGLLGFDESGELVWVNSMASTLLRVPIDPTERGPCTIEDILELKPSQMRALADGTLRELFLTQGPHVHIRCHAQSDTAPHMLTAALSPLASAPHPVPKPEEPALADGYLPPNNLKEADADLIRKCLAECHGNVSSVARKLKVSRGLIYRRLTALSIEPSHFKAN